MNDDIEQYKLEIKEKEARMKEYAEFNASTLADEAKKGRRNKDNCQKCGGLGFLPYVKTVPIDLKIKDTEISSREYYFVVSECGCLKRW